MKRNFLKFCGATIGTNVRIASSASFQLTGQLTIGDNTWIGHQVLVAGGNAPVIIGSNVDIGPRVTLVTGSHKLWETPLKAAGKGYSTPINIKNGAWIGACSTIIGGVTIGKSAVVGAGSLVNKDVQPDTSVAGVPAIQLKTRTDIIK